jgi:excisionase family DNA binding protein
MMSRSSPVAYGISEACALARVGRTTMYDMVRCGELRARKRGRRTLILADDLRQWLEALPQITPYQMPVGPAVAPAQAALPTSRRSANCKTGKEL